MDKSPNHYIAALGQSLHVPSQNNDDDDDDDDDDSSSCNETYLKHVFIQSFATTHPLLGFMHIEIQNTQWLHLMMRTCCIKYKQLLPPNFQEAHYTSLATEMSEQICMFTYSTSNITSTYEWQ
jgi:hypothetical protein